MHKYEASRSAGVHLYVARQARVTPEATSDRNTVCAAALSPPPTPPQMTPARDSNASHFAGASQVWPATHRRYCPTLCAVASVASRVVGPLCTLKVCAGACQSASVAEVASPVVPGVLGGRRRTSSHSRRRVPPTAPMGMHASTVAMATSADRCSPACGAAALGSAGQAT